MNTDHLSKKTPTRFSGIQIDREDFEDTFYNWSKEEQLEFLAYFERDKIRESMTVGCFLGAVFGVIIGFIIILFLKPQ